MSDEEIDPMKEAAKQYFRENRGKALEVEGVATRYFILMMVFSTIGASIAHALKIDSEIYIPVIIALCLWPWIVPFFKI